MAGYSDYSFAAHGGAVDEASRRWGVSREEILDFSANINPLGPPIGIHQALANGWEAVKSYPDTERFVSTLSAKLGVGPENIVPGNGSTGLIFAAVRALKTERALLLEPAFSEYRRSLRAVGTHIDSVLLCESDEFCPDFHLVSKTLHLSRSDLIILNNPHNPSGAAYSPAAVKALAAEAEQRGASVIVDEAFVDYSPEVSVLSDASVLRNVIVLRSLTKFYAIPGLRIGYAVCNGDLASRLREQIEAWPATCLALDAAVAALADSAFEEQSRQQNELVREQFRGALDRLSLTVYPSAANFLLIKLEEGRRGASLAQWLERYRVLIRRCDTFSGLGDRFARLAVRSKTDNERLVGLIGEWMEETDSFL